MLPALSAFFYRIASWKTLLPAVMLYVLFPAYLLKNLEATMNALAGKPVGPIDLLLGYDPAKISQMVEAYGPEGRAVYAQGSLIIDSAYPVVYTFLFCVILSLLFKNRDYVPFRLANILPVGILVFDFLENACIIYLLKSYPNSSSIVTSLCSIFTNLKWAVTLVVAVLALYGVVRLLLGGRSRNLEQA